MAGMTNPPDTLLDGCRRELEAALAEPLLAACPFGRTDLIAVPAPRSAGGLPERFVLALTPTRLAAYAVDDCCGEPETGTQLASWPRLALRVVSARRGGMVRVAIEAGCRDDA